MEPKIPLREFTDIYKEVCEAMHPLIRYELDDDKNMLRQATFVKQKALQAIANFLYNKGIQSLPATSKMKK